MNTLSGDPRFSVETRTGKKKVSNVSLNVAEAFIKRWPAEKELEMPDIPWLNIDEGILRLGETAVLEWVGSVKPNPPQWEGPEGRPFTTSVKHKMVRGCQSFEEFCCSLFPCARP